MKKTKKGVNILFATFSPWENGRRMPTNGMIEPMLRYFVPKTSLFVLIDLPHPGSDRLMPVVEIYKKGRLFKKPKPNLFLYLLYPFLKASNTVGTRISFKIRDFLTVLAFGLSSGYKYDLFIGLESINATAGCLLKRLGLVKKVVYYVSDFSPKRYKAGWFNKVYLYLDKIATNLSDYVWDVSPAMMPARIKLGVDPKNQEKTILVPNALNPEQISFLPRNKINRMGLAYAGTLGFENGPDLAVQALGIVTRKIPSVKLNIFGGGEDDLKRLKSLTKKLDLEEKVLFRGFIRDQLALSSEIKKLGVGLAPYRAIPGSPRWWADATKIRLYLAAGLPVVTTQVPPLGKEIVEKGAGKIAKDNPKSFAAAIIELLENRRAYDKTRENAIKLAEGNTWDNTYNSVLTKMSFEI